MLQGTGYEDMVLILGSKLELILNDERINNILKKKLKDLLIVVIIKGEPMHRLDWVEAKSAL